MNDDFRCAWITWEKQIRNRSLSKQFNADFYEFDYAGNQIARYFKCIIKTLVILSQNRKGVVFVQNPSIVLSLVAVLFKPFFEYILIVDSHNSAIFPAQKWVQWVAGIIVKNADFTIVTNQNLADIIADRGGRPLILPDALPSFHNADYLRKLEVQRKKVFFICSWASDEPYFEVFKAAEKLPDYKFYITGKSRGKELGYGKALPNNVVLTGYIPDDEYHEMLATSEVIIDLTTREDCLVCGAYEATAMERPFIVSDKKAIRAYFQSGCLYVDNTADGVVSGIVLMAQNYAELKQAIEVANVSMAQQWATLFKKAKTCIFERFALATAKL